MSAIPSFTLTLLLSEKALLRDIHISSFRKFPNSEEIERSWGNFICGSVANNGR